MRTRLTIIALTGLTLSGCATTQGPGRPLPIEGDAITLETGPCFGRCPVYAVTVRPDGRGLFTGKRFTSVSGEKPFTLTRAQYDAFAKRLAPYRPNHGEIRYAPGEANCQHAATDLPSVDVTWTRAVGDRQHLYFYFGCNRGNNQAMRDALGNATDLLPIDALVGPRP